MSHSACRELRQIAMEALRRRRSNSIPTFVGDFSPTGNEQGVKHVIHQARENQV